MSAKSDFVDLINLEYVVHDGALGTMLQQRGLTPDELPEEWNIRKPEVVRDIHLEYLNAGAQIVTTNTFGASPIKMGMRGKEGLVEEVSRRGVQLALDAVDQLRSIQSGEKHQRDGELYIAGSVGPSGKLLNMEITPGEAEKSISLQVQVLAEAGVDLILIETMIDLGEAELALKVARRETNLPVIVSLAFDRTKQGSYRTLFGNTPAEAALRLADGGACAVGANCGLIEHYVDVMKEMRGVCGVPLIFYPNAGRPIVRKGVTFYGETPRRMIAWLNASIEAGATIIGGCCGTTPEYIALLSRRIRNRKRNI